MTQQGRRAAFDLPAGYNRELLAYSLFYVIEDLALDADQEELKSLAHRATNVANNLVFAASEAGIEQRRRLADQRGSAPWRRLHNVA